MLTKKQLEPNPFSQYIADENQGVKVNITGVVSEIKEKQISIQIQLKKCYITPNNETDVCIPCTGILLSVESADCQIGDCVEVSGKIKPFATIRNPGEFDQGLYYQSLHIQYKCSGKIIKVTQHTSNKILQKILLLKKKLSNSYDTICEDSDAAIYKSIVIGDKDDLSQEIRDMYKENGIAHLLSISGLHIAIIGYSFYSFIRKRGLSFLEASIISAVMIIAYGVMTGNGVSTVRAIIMFMAAMGAEVTGRAYDILSACSLASLILLADSPLMITNCGFLLSFGAILAIVIVSPAVDTIFTMDKETRKEQKGRLKTSKNKSEKRKIRLRLGLSFAWKLLNVSFSINLVTFPIILYFYYEIPIYSVFLNIIVIPLMTLVMISAILGGVLGIFQVTVGMAAAGMGHYILLLYEKLCGLFGSLPYAQVIVGKPKISTIVLYYIILVTFVIVMNLSEKHSKKIAVLLVLDLVILFTRFHKNLTIYMVDVGQGDCIVVRTPQNVTYMFDCGSTDVKSVARYRVVPFLKSEGIAKLDYIIVSHTDADHINGIEELLADNQGLEINHLLLPDIKDRAEAYSTLETMAAEAVIGVNYVQAGNSIKQGKLSLSFLHPYPDMTYSSANSSSTVVLLNYKEFDMLFTGDLEAEGEERIIADGNLKDIDVLKTAHHGSGYSTGEKFLSIVKPEIAIVSAGIKNKYGHPHADLLQRLANVNADVSVTAESGCIRLETDGTKLDKQIFIKANSHKEK